MAELKTKPTGRSVGAFLKSIVPEERRRDCAKLAAMMRRVTGEKPRLWGTGIVGFGTYHYKYATGREGDWFRTGFAPRRNDLTLYVMSGFNRHADLLARLGKYKTGTACLYIKRLADVDETALTELIARSVREPMAVTS